MFQYFIVLETHLVFNSHDLLYYIPSGGPPFRIIPPTQYTVIIALVHEKRFINETKCHNHTRQFLDKLRRGKFWKLLACYTFREKIAFMNRNLNYRNHIWLRGTVCR